MSQDLKTRWPKILPVQGILDDLCTVRTYLREFVHVVTLLNEHVA